MLDTIARSAEWPVNESTRMMVDPRTAKNAVSGKVKRRREGRRRGAG
jgi:hypothetical protein